MYKLDYGIEQGRADGLIAVARNLIKMELPLTKIADATGLSLDEIKKLAN